MQRTLSVLSAFLFAGGLSLPAASAQGPSPGADPPVMVWGFQRGCDGMEDTGRYVQKQIEEAGVKPVYYLGPEPARLGCQGAACAAQVRDACPGAKGHVIGGIFQQSADRTVTQARVWVHNLSTGQTLWQDSYCAACSLSNMVATMGTEMILRGTGDTTTPGATPLYCVPGPSYPDRPPFNPKVYWVVYGKDHQRAAITSGMRKAIEETAGQEIPFEHIGREYTPALLKKVLSKDPTAQVIGAQVQAGGTVQMFIYDGRTEKVEQQVVECASCDKEEFETRVKRASLLMLSQCFGDKCVESGVAKARPPKNACVPFEEIKCGDPKYRGILGVSPGTNLGLGDASQSVIQPGLARALTGLSWGAVALMGATTAGLLVANYAGAGTVIDGNLRGRDVLTTPMWTMAGATAIALGVAVPITILVGKAAPTAPKAAPLAARPAQGLQCP